MVTNFLGFVKNDKHCLQWYQEPENCLSFERSHPSFYTHLSTPLKLLTSYSLNIFTRFDLVKVFNINRYYHSQHISTFCSVTVASITFTNLFRSKSTVRLVLKLYSVLSIQNDLSCISMPYRRSLMSSLLLLLSYC